MAQSLRAIALLCPLAVACSLALGGLHSAWARPGERPPGLDVALSDSPLDIGPLAAGQLAHSPSMVAYGDGALLAYRLDTPTDDPNTPDSRIVLVPLDADFRPCGPGVLLDLRMRPQDAHTAQDPRLLWLGDDLLLAFSQGVGEQTPQARRMHVACLRVADGTRAARPLSVSIERLARIQPPAGLKLVHVEKRWTPFVHEGLLWFLCRHNPPIAVGVDAASLIAGGPSLDTFGPIADAPQVSSPVGMWRGGTPAMRGPDDLYEAFVEWSERIGPKTYSSLGFVTLEAAPPFAWQASVPRPLVIPNLEDDSTATLSEAVPGGFLRRGERVYLVYGRHGRAIHLLSLHAGALARRLVPIEPPKEAP